MALRAVAILFVAAGVAALAAPVSAARLLGGTVGVDARLATSFDSNILRLPSGAIRQPGETRDEIRYQPSITATYTRPLGRQSILLSALVGRDYYQNNDFLTRDRILLVGNLNYVVGASCRGVANASLSKRQAGTRLNLIDPDVIDPIIDPGPDDDSGRTIDNRQEVFSTGLNASCGAAGGAFSFGGNVNRFTLRNKALTRRFADSDTTTVGGFVGLGVLRPGQLQIVGSYSEIKYPNSGALAGLPVPFLRPAVDTYRVGLNYSRPIGTRLTGSIGAAYLTGKPRGPGGSSYSSPAYNFGLTYRPGTRLTLGLNGSRDIISSNSAGALFQVIDSASLTAFYRASPSLTARTAVSVQRRDFKQSFATIEDLVARQKQTFTVLNAGVTYAPRRLYDVSIDVSHGVRKSTPSIFDYDNTTAIVSLAVHL